MRVGSFVVAFVVVALAASSCGAPSESPAGSGDVSPTPTPAPSATPQGVAPPIVLMHGMAGFTDIAGMEYFNGVPEALRADGYSVFTTSVDPFQSVEVRASQAAAQIDAILAETGATKVHLIGHSQGGLDARYVVSALGYGDRVATITTIATPHHGSKVADVALGLIPGNAVSATAALADALLGTATGTNADIGTQTHELTASYCDGTFNPANPDDPRVTYYSVAGRTQPWLLVNPATTDIVNPIFYSSWFLEDAMEGDNDGLVSQASATWGQLLGVVPADHLDEIGLPPGAVKPFDHIRFYRRLAKFLYGQGPNPLSTP